MKSLLNHRQSRLRFPLSRRFQLSGQVLQVCLLLCVLLPNNTVGAENQDDSSKSSFWLKPFLLQNPPEENSTAKTSSGNPFRAFQLTNPQSSNKATTPKKGKYWFNPFTWKNSSSSDRQIRQTGTAVQTASHNPQGSNPFQWTNTDEAQQNATQSPYGQGFGEIINGSALATPFHVTNSPEQKRSPDLQPTPLPPVGDVIMSALRYEERRDVAIDGPQVTGLPPENASIEEMIAWEKQKFPWVRPFYLAEKPESQQPAIRSYDEDGRIIAFRDSWWAQPFLWTNGSPNNLVAQRRVGDSRPVAYFQNDEEIPTPQGQPGNSEEILTPEGNTPALGDTEVKGALAEAESLGKEPVDNSLQFLRADTVLLDPGQFQFDYGLAYSLADTNGVIATDLGGGLTSIDLFRFRQRSLIAPFEIRMGLLRRLQLFLNVPVGWGNTEFTYALGEEFENDGGLGDITFGGTFLVRQGNHCCSDIIWTFAATAPTGAEPFFPAGISPVEPALGSGVWSLSSSMLWVRNYDPVVFFYGIGGRQYFTTDINGNEYQPGSEFNYRMGLGFAVNEKITFSTRFRGAYVEEARLNEQRIVGSIQEPMSLECAVTVARCKKLIEPFVNFGLTDDSNDVSLGIVWTR